MSLHDDIEGRELREEWGGLWLLGAVLALCGVGAIVSFLREVSRRMRGRS